MKCSCIIIAASLLFADCRHSAKTDLPAKAKQEILDAEAAFAATVSKKGEKTAFLEFADDSAVIKRGTMVFTGKKEIAEYFAAQQYTDVTLQWHPDYVFAANSGDLGYTFGKYSFSALDSAKNKMEITGIFHTVWKKQSDGSWKYVYD